MFNIYAYKYAPMEELVDPCEIKVVPIGYKGETFARCMVFDLSKCITELGEGTFVVKVKPKGEAAYEAANTDQLDDQAIWIIDDTDTATAGEGYVQLIYTAESDAVAMTATYKTFVFDSL